MGPGLVSIVMPAHNEVDTLASAVDEVLQGMRSRARPFEIVVVENGSLDGTIVIGHRLDDENAEVRLMSLPDADYGRALRAGFLAAAGDVVVNFDVDFVDLDFLDRAVELLDASGPAIVIGSKRAVGATDRRPWHRRFVTAGFAWLLRTGFGLRASDTHGIKAMSRTRVTPLVNACRLGTDLYDTELVLRAERGGVPIAEIPVSVEERRPPRSSIARRAARSLFGLLRLRDALRSA